MLCLPIQFAVNKYLQWWSFYIPVTCYGWCLSYPTRHTTRTSGNGFLAFWVGTVSSFCDNQSFLFTADMQNPFFINCSNAIQKWMFEMGERCVQFLSESSWRIQIMSLKIFLICSRCSKTVEHDILSFYSKSLLFVKI